MSGFTDPSRCPGQSGQPSAKAQAPRNRRASGTARSDNESLDAYVREVVDSLPPLTEAQRDLLALIFRYRQR